MTATNSATPRPNGRGSVTSPTPIVGRSKALTALRRILKTAGGKFGFFGILFFVMLGLLGPLLVPYDPFQLGPNALAAPSAEHWMGTDALGRDYFSRFLFGTQVSVFVSMGAVAIGVVFGLALGLIAGWRSNTVVDGIIMRFMDIIMAFPLLVLVPVVTGIIGQSNPSIGPITLTPPLLVTLAIGFVLIPGFARLSRAGVLGEKGKDYVLANRSFGARPTWIVVRNILPNIIGPIIVQAAFGIASAVGIESAVSFLGLGVQPPAASWGTLMADGRNYLMLDKWWLIGFPLLALVLAVLSFTFLGDRARDVFDPRDAR